ncbi:MAG: uracil-DNA glycosylase [Minwuia sp.]|nr:uracil-DNA glycosylase [Minwuia sp.]
MTDTAHQFQADLAALAFLVDAGLDIAIGSEPTDRLKPPPEPERTPRATAAPSEPQPRPQMPPTRQVIRQESDEVVSERQAAITAQQLAAQCSDLTALRQALEGFQGLAIRETATQLVFADGNPDADVMLIGEAPGRDEDRIGRPFVGESGKLLDRMLAAIGLDRQSVYITNTVLWRPPGNRKPTPSEVTAMLPFLVRHIELVAPKLLLLTGGSALGALFDFEARITRERGRWRDYPAQAGPIPALPMFHPAYLLRQPALKRQAWADLLSFRQKLDELGIATRKG